MSATTDTEIKEALPTELIYEIIAIIVGQGSGAKDPAVTSLSPLAAASLVSRTWNAICRPHIFHTLGRDRITGSISTRLAFLHFEAPHLSGYIRSVELNWLTESHHFTTEWLAESLSRLRNLRTLHLKDMLFTSTMGPPPLYAGIISMVGAPYLRKLVLLRCYFPEDGSDLYSILPTSLEELKLTYVLVRADFSATSVTRSPNPMQTLRLHALRTLELHHVVHPAFSSKNFIECPNLERLTTLWCYDWDLPPWIPSSVSELVLHDRGTMRSFPTAMYPSTVTMILLDSVSFLNSCTWIRACIARFSFMETIQELKLNLTHSLHPTLWDYGVFSRVLQPLFAEERLQSVFLNLTLPASAGVNDPALLVDEVEAGLAELSVGNVLDVKIERDDTTRCQVVRCSLQRREVASR
ncbi:hypothetical protein AB1N83_010635 [Pleurotus pulmonarius]